MFPDCSQIRASEFRNLSRTDWHRRSNCRRITLGMMQKKGTAHSGPGYLAFARVISCVPSPTRNHCAYSPRRRRQLLVPVFLSGEFQIPATCLFPYFQHITATERERVRRRTGLQAPLLQYGVLSFHSEHNQDGVGALASFERIPQRQKHYQQKS